MVRLDGRCCCLQRAASSVESFFFQAEDGIRYLIVTGVQTCALPILIQGEANAIAPLKRMLSAMTPSIVLDRSGRLFMVVGTPGGPTIINSVYQVIVNVQIGRASCRERV